MKKIKKKIAMVFAGCVLTLLTMSFNETVYMDEEGPEIICPPGQVYYPDIAYCDWEDLDRITYFTPAVKRNVTLSFVSGGVTIASINYNDADFFDCLTSGSGMKCRCPGYGVKYLFQPYRIYYACPI